MKRILLLLIVLPTLTFAQKINISALGGIAATSLDNSAKSSWVKENSAGFFGSLQASASIKKFAVGLRSDFYKIKASSTLSFPDLVTNEVKQGTITSNAFNPAINLSVFANRRFNLGRAYIFAGINGGLLFGSSKNSYDFDTKSVLIDPSPESGSASGYSLGIQAGAGISINKNLALFAELSPRYVFCSKSFGTSNASDYFNSFVIPAGVGLTLSF